MKRLLWCVWLGLTGCSMAPDWSLPDVPAPEQWSHDAPAADTGKLDESWWGAFGSEALPTLVVQAEANNPDLAAALARVAQAQATARIAGASAWPEVDATATGGRDFNNRPTLASPRAENSYRAGFQASYEVDLFGKNRDAANASAALAQASAYDREALRLSVVAQTAQSYFDTLALQERVQIAERNLDNARQVLDVIRIRAQSGLLSSLEVAQQEHFVGSSEAALAVLRQQSESSKNSLAVLVGALPESFTLEAAALKDFSAPGLPVIMPREWLARRPDIASAEAQLKAANFDIGAARSAFLPSITLDAGTALAANPASAAAATLSSLAAGIGMPLFTGGALEGGWEHATARQQELAALYRKTALTAYAEVENTLTAVDAQQTREEGLAKAAAAAEAAYNASRIRFDAGAIDAITLLDAQRTQLQAEDALAQARADRLSASVDMFRAMGGGWKRAE